MRAILRKKKNKASLFPIAIHITKDRKSTFLSTGQYIIEKYWDERNRHIRKSHPNAKSTINFILNKVIEVNKKTLKAEL
jgi:hypothetical protein